jgi:hypothetical protein
VSVCKVCGEEAFMEQRFFPDEPLTKNLVGWFCYKHAIRMVGPEPTSAHPCGCTGPANRCQHPEVYAEQAEVMALMERPSSS